MKKVCKKCHEVRAIGKGRVTCYRCLSSTGPCVICNKVRRFYIKSKECSSCQEDPRARQILLTLEFDREPLTPYNQHLFALYLTYLRRYALRNYHARQAIDLRDILIRNEIKAIQSWMDIYQSIKKYPIAAPRGKREGCAFTKIGSMLEELGVLPPRAEEKGRQIENLLTGLSSSSQFAVKLFFKALTRAGRTPGTIHKYLYHFREFERWMVANISKEATLITANQIFLENYLAHLHDLYSDQESQGRSKFIYEAYSAMDCFFRFCVSEKKLINNPCAKIQVSQTQKRIHICTADQIKKLQVYIKSPSANPEYAMLLAMVLFYGLTTNDLKCAQLAEPFEAKIIKIILRRKPRSHGKKHYHRPQIITCPMHPSWFLRLQNEFLNFWRLLYVQVKSTYPRFSFLLPRHRKYNRPLATDTVRERMAEATIAATGVNIPIRVLRQTCGHLHTHYRDASALSTLGWSPEFAYYFSWGTRTYFTPRESIS